MKRSSAAASGDPPTLDEVKANIEKRLFLGRLPVGTSEEELREVFGSFGTLKECRVLPEKGVAFVGYDTWAAAHRALLATDGQECLRGCAGLPISASFAERTGSSRGVHFAKGLEHNRVFVGGLPESCTDQDLRQLFEVFGRVEAANLLAAKSNRRCGFVNFALWGEALDAIELLDGQKYPGTYGEAMTVVLASPREGPITKIRRVESAPAAADLAVRTAVPELRTEGDPEFQSLKVAYLAAVDGDTPAKICDELHQKIMALRPASRQAYEGATALDTTAAALLGTPLQFAGDAGPLPPIATNCEERDAARLFVGGLPYECTDEELRALVDQVQFTVPPAQHLLLECRVLPGRGCGYVRFSSWEAAIEAIQALNERAVSGWLTPLRVRWATPKALQQQIGAVQPSPEKLLQLSMQQVAHATPANDLNSALQALLGGDGGGLQGLLGGGDGGALQGLLGGDLGTALAQQLAAAAAGGLGAVQASTSQDESVVAAQGLDPKRLFVGQLSRELNDKAALTRLFEPFGTVQSLRWLEDKGVAYVQYNDFTAASAAHATLNGKHIPGISREQGLNINFSRIR